MTDEFVGAMRDWIETLMRRSMQAFILYAKSNGMSMTQINAMMMLKRQGSSGISDFGERLGVTRAAASQMVDRLVQAGFILRSEDPNDRRSKTLVLTDEGREFIRGAIQAREQWLVELSETLTPAERDQTIAVMHLLVNKTELLDHIPEPEI